MLEKNRPIVKNTKGMCNFINTLPVRMFVLPTSISTCKRIFVYIINKKCVDIERMQIYNPIKTGKEN